ncbi:MAG TPA: UpxY family transcription antiterminator [Smithellaceae bacterium]|nr:UpxY family transcription antiterminator [Smithellaceae bacterium]
MPWYAVNTRSRHEYKVNSGLAQKGLVTFLPEIEVWSKRKDRKKKILIPLFSGYLFVETPCLNNETKLSILKTFGVVRILGKKENAEALAVPDSKIEAIRRFLSKKVEVFSLQYPQIGEPAKIIDGPFAGVEGIVIDSKMEKELFVVSIELLQRSVAIRLEGFQITKI